MPEIEEKVVRGGHGTGIDEIAERRIRDTLARPDVAYNIAICATVLGIPHSTLHTFIDKNPELAARCPGKNPAPLVPQDLDLLDREPKVGEILLPKEQAQMIKALIRKNDKVIRNGWGDLGMSDADAKSMEEAERRSRMPLSQIIAASDGDLIMLQARSAQMLDRISDQIVNGSQSKHGPLPKITDIAGSDKTEHEYIKIFQSGVMVHINLQQAFLKSRAAMIDAMKKLKDMQAEAGKPQKGVFVTDAPENNKR